MMRDVHFGSRACGADVTHVSLTCGPDSKLNTSKKTAKHTKESNLGVMVRLVEAIIDAKTTKLLILEDGSAAGTSEEEHVVQRQFDQVIVTSQLPTGRFSLQRCRWMTKIGSSSPVARRWLWRCVSATRGSTCTGRIYMRGRVVGTTV